MPTEGDCKRRAEANKALADSLASAGDFNWAITATFYAVVHQVNRLKVRANCYSDDGSHIQTQNWINRTHPAASSAYVALNGKSRRTRYEVGYEADQDAFDRATRHYVRLADYVDRVIAGAVPGV